MQSPSFPVFIGLAGFCFLGGCATAPVPVTPYRSPLPPRGIILVVDGAGGNLGAARAVAAAVEESGTPLYVRSFEWTHGIRHGLLDMTDVDYARAQGRRLAEQITLYRQTCPNTPIFVVGYSAGAHVALVATQWLEPNSLERLVLLAPAVSADYDLRQALGVARQGIDAFTSKRDRFYLGLAPRIVGTADGKRGVPPAGRVGFDMPPITAADVGLAQRLRQYPWEPGISWSGNLGNHSGSLSPAYFRAYVLPLLTTAANPG